LQSKLFFPPTQLPKRLRCIILTIRPPPLPVTSSSFPLPQLVVQRLLDRMRVDSNSSLPGSAFLHFPSKSTSLPLLGGFFAVGDLLWFSHPLSSLPPRKHPRVLLEGSSPSCKPAARSFLILFLEKEDQVMHVPLHQDPPLRSLASAISPLFFLSSGTPSSFFIWN